MEYCRNYQNRNFDIETYYQGIHQKQTIKKTNLKNIGLLFFTALFAIAVFAYVSSNYYDVLQLIQKQQINQEISNDLQQPYIPSQFDIRYTAIGRMCSGQWIAQEEGMCIGGNWGNLLVDTLQNLLCLNNKPQMLLSANQLIACSQQQNACDQFNTTNFFTQAINYLSSNGVTDSKCLAYDPINPWMPQCTNICSNGTTIMQRYKASFLSFFGTGNSAQTQIAAMNYVLNYGPILMMMNYTTSMAQYKGGVYQHYQGQMEQSMGYRIFKIVGWGSNIDNSKYWIAANTFSQNWGNAGYAYINQTDQYILNYYAVNPSTID